MFQNRIDSNVFGISKHNHTIRKSTATAFCSKFKNVFVALRDQLCQVEKNATRKPTSIKCSEIKHMLETKCGQNIQATLSTLNLECFALYFVKEAQMRKVLRSARPHAALVIKQLKYKTGNSFR